MATSAATDTSPLLAELDHVRWMVADWKQRGSPIVEKAVLETRLAAAEAAVAHAHAPEPVHDPVSALPASATPEAKAEHKAKTHAHHAAKIAAVAAKTAVTSTAKAAASMLDKETNARFWAQTNYKVGQKLDMSNPTDKAMAKVWSDIFAKVKAEDNAGQLVLTYNHPVVEQHLDNAETAQAAAAIHATNAVLAETPEETADHVRKATAATNAAAQATSQAAVLQPPTVSPVVAHEAAHEAAAAAGAPAPAPPVPGRANPGLKPKRGPHPHVHPHPQGTPPVLQITSPGMLQPIGGNASDHLALDQALNAGHKAADVHDLAQAHPSVPSSTVDNGTIAQIRAHGQDLAAADAASSFVATALLADNSWHASHLPDRDALDGWYGELTDHPDTFKYAAVWDKSDAPNWGAGMPSNETFGSGKAIDVHVAVERPPAMPPAAPIIQEKTNLGPAFALGAVALAGGVSVFAGRRKKRKV